MGQKKKGALQGLHFMAFDLHVHTPASNDYEDKNATAEDIVRAAIARSLDAICIADHNTAEWVDAVTKAASGTRLSVFPGVEISVTGGKEGPIHIIGIFDMGTSSEEINDLLSMVGLTKAKRGDLNELADGDPNNVINELVRQHAIPILAHVDSSHGVLHDMRGQPRIKVVQNQNVQAAEASKPDYIGHLDGNDPTYKRYLPTYESSDAHSLGDIGKKRTHLKVSYPCLEAIRQSFLDPDIRICNQNSYSQKSAEAFPKILSIRIDQGFFQDTCIQLHPCQNCLIGGQGVGKSLIVEFIRFALDQRSSNEQVRKDSDSKLLKQLGIGGSVRIDFELPNGTKYTITRKYDSINDPIEVMNIGTGDTYRGEIAALFPIVAYSQTEAVEISRNQNAQLELIDGLIDAVSVQKQIESTQQALFKSDKKLSQLMNAQTSVRAISMDISTKTEAIANIEKALKNPILSSMKHAEELKDAFESHVAYHDELEGAIEEWLTDLSDSYAPAVSKGKLSELKVLQEAEGLSKASYNSLKQTLTTAKESLRANKASQKKRLSLWIPEYNAVLESYEKFLRKQGGDIRTLAGKRKLLIDEMQELEKNRKSYSQQANQIGESQLVRKQLLDDLEQTLNTLYETRKVKYEDLSNLSGGKLRISIAKAADTSGFASALAGICTGTHIRKADIVKIAQAVSPRDLLDWVIEEDISAISERADIEEDTLKKLANWLMSLEVREKVLELQHAVLPQDVPLIEFKKDDGQYYPISDISVGQKCTALLMIALATGSDPIIVDQPEESIDIASVFSDVVSKLRSNKFERQFVLTTHNPNIAVTADSDLIHVLKASATVCARANGTIVVFN